MTHESSIKKILCAVDFSEISREVLADAVVMASKFKAELVIMNVLNEKVIEDIRRLDGRVHLFDGIVEDAVRSQEEERAQKLKALLSEVDLSELVHSSSVTMGLPWEKILQKAEEESIDLIILGAKGRGARLRHLRFGSTAEKVFRRAECRVMFVR